MMNYSDNEYENQLLLYLKNWFHYYAFTFVSNCCLAVHYIYVIFQFFISIYQHMIYDLYFITSLIVRDLLKVFSLVHLSINIYFIILQSTICFLFIIDTTKYIERLSKIYTEIKGILLYFHILPLSRYECTVGYLILKNAPEFIWKYIMPFPHFFFEETFKKRNDNLECEIIRNKSKRTKVTKNILQSNEKDY